MPTLSNSYIKSNSQTFLNMESRITTAQGLGGEGREGRKKGERGTEKGGTKFMNDLKCN
jgi:hypothetical protein